MVKDVEDFAETDEFGIEMKEQATMDAQELRSNFEKLTQKHFHTLFNEPQETLP